MPPGVSEGAAQAPHCVLRSTANPMDEATTRNCFPNTVCRACLYLTWTSRYYTSVGSYQTRGSAYVAH